jgi:hypothetical protein
MEARMREPEERPGLPLWLPEPYHGPRPPEGYPLPRKPKKAATQHAAGKRPSQRPNQHASQRPAAIVRVATVIVGAIFATVIIMITIVLIQR